MGTLYEVNSNSGRTRYGFMIEGTQVDMVNYTDKTIGQQWYDTDTNKVWTWSQFGFWYVVGETMILTKQSPQILKGQLVVASGFEGCEVASTPDDTGILGVCVWGVEEEEKVVIAYAGLWDVLCSDDSNPYSVGDFLEHDGSPTAEEGQAKAGTASGIIGICMEAGSVSAGGGLLRAFIQNTERF